MRSRILAGLSPAIAACLLLLCEQREAAATDSGRGAADSLAVRPIPAFVDTTALAPVGPAADSSRVGSGINDAPTAAPGRSVRSRRTPQIWWTTLRSGLAPGWGQLVNRKPLKAILLAGVDGFWLAGALKYESDRKVAVRAADVTAVNKAVDRRNFRIWMMGATAIYAMLDAYVDAHFYNYDEGWTGRIGPDAAGRPQVGLAYRF